MSSHNKRTRNTKRNAKSKRPYAPSRLREGRSAARVGPITQADETDVRLRYINNSYITNNAGGVASYEWTPNAAYDVDPAFGSTATNGFDPYAMMYSYYRVYAYTYKIEVVNNETKPVVAYCYNTNTAVSGSSLDVYAGSPYCSTAILGPANSGTSRHVFTGRVNISRLLGSVEAETDATTRALVTGVPSDLIFLTLYASATSGLATLTNGVAYIASVTMNVRFYGRIYNASNSISHVSDRLAQLVQAREEYNLKKKLALKTSSRPPVGL